MEFDFPARLLVARRVFDHAWVKAAFALWSIICAYDTLSSQVIPASWVERFPKVWRIVAATSGWIPFWGWLLILAALLVVASFEYAFRRANLLPSQASSLISPILLHKYADLADRKNLRTALRELSKILNVDISTSQAEVHRLIDDTSCGVGTVDVSSSSKKLQALIGKLSTARSAINEKYIHGMDYSNEILDILGNRDDINATIVSLEEYISAIEAKPTGALVKLLRAPEDVARNANFSMGNWAADCMKRLNSKREALDQLDVI